MIEPEPIVSECNKCVYFLNSDVLIRYAWRDDEGDRLPSIPVCRKALLCEAWLVPSSNLLKMMPILSIFPSGVNSKRSETLVSHFQTLLD